ncbi:Stc1 domain-containing protein [Pseudomassariella vexata]|uniref:Stc1 domain-domain-containing protein n=1 Tax=Pseudomassariella vexata TaxID=1141098 RepID=A0A1Y2DA79_9PEZI|nr:Stc1 domain-containing protein [Pseudomassariella vexata]ORY56107.1 Stc1 domain-domain-containing protein [Pseudomassariella vexata]
MAGKSKFQNFGVKRGRNFPLPERFRCAVDGKMEPPTAFSNNQLAKWHNTKKSNNDGITPFNIKLTCRKHSGEPARELKCHGPCGLWKARDKFSHSQRRNKLRWCAGCVRWKEQQDYDSVPLPAPNGQVSPDEMVGVSVHAQVEKAIGFEKDENAADHQDFDDEDTDYEDEGGPEAIHNTRGYDYDEHDFGFDSDDSDDAIRITQVKPTENMNESIASLSIDDGNRVPSVAGSAMMTETSSVEYESKENWVPPHLRHSGGQPSTAGQVSDRSSVAASVDFNMPQQNFRPGSISSVVLPHQHAPSRTSGQIGSRSVASSDSRAGIDSMSTYSQSVKGKRGVGESASKTFIGYGPDGNAMEKTTAPSQAGTSSTRTTGGGYNIKSRPEKNGWARPDQRKTFHENRNFGSTTGERILDHDPHDPYDSDEDYC